MFPTLLILGLILTALALPPAVTEGSWRRFGSAAALSFVGVILPLLVFLVGAFLTPSWKGGCRLGWVDCFHLGKLALTPLVLWAVAAWYAVEILRTPERQGPLLVLGLWNGMVLTLACFLFGAASLGANEGASGEMLWLFVPLSMAVWYGVRAVQLSRRAGLSWFHCACGIAGVAPFWWFSVAWSRQIFADLPDQPPSCFVVTAAARGHVAIVGPHVAVVRRGQVRRVSRQLATFWQLEDLWSREWPWSHQTFRRLYNVIGPMIARQITLRWQADLVHICLMPVERFACAVLWAASVRQRSRLTPIARH